MASSLKVILVIVCLLVILIGAERQWDIPEYERNIETFEPGIIVQTKLGKLEGIRVRTKYDINGTVTNSYEMFKGIPYAKPPVGSRRFEAPEPVDPWPGVRDATRHGKVCPQDEHIWINSRWPRGEDCLSLSIYTPYMDNNTDDTATFPVIFFIHGGSYEVGSEKMYDGGVLSLFGVVVVMINYRLGLLGFLSSGNDILPGNYGLLDQIEALKWTKEHIHSFRGDPDGITIMGQSVGSSSVGLLLVSPLSRGLFHNAIMQSGAVLARYAYQSLEQNNNITAHFKQVGQVHGCSSEDLKAIRDCMKQLHWKRVISSRHKFPINDPVVPEFRPFVDGYVLPKAPEQLFRDSQYWKVPVLHGVVADELSQYTFWDTHPRGDDHWISIARRISGSLTKVFSDQYGESLVPVINNKYSKWTAEDGMAIQYTKMIEDSDFVVPLVVLSELMSQTNPRVYQYYFSAVPDSYHLVDLYYVFGTPYSNKQCCNEIRWFGEEDKVISNLMMSLWAEFATTGRLIIKGEEMPAYKASTKKYLHIDKNGASIHRDLHQPTVEFWTEIVPSLALRHSNKTISSDHSEKSTLLTVLLGGLAFLMALTCVVLFIIMCCRKRKGTLQLQHTIV